MPTQEQVTEAHNNLSNFLRDVLELLEQLATSQHDEQGRRLFPEELAQSIRAAWQEFREGFDLENALAKIRALSAAQLHAGGLYGSQLALKLRVIERWRERFRAFGGRRILKKLIDAIDTLLESLIAATGIDEALKELKDILCDSTDDDDQD